MLIDAATKGARTPDGCTVRRWTGDTSGGLTVGQMRGPCAHYGVPLAVHTGPEYLTPGQFARALRERRPIIIQGNTSATLKTTWRSTLSGVNHCIVAVDARGWQANGLPDEVLIGDPAADGRKRAYHVDQGPSWWPWRLVLAFAAALHPFGERDSRIVGAGKVWCGVGPSGGSLYPLPPVPPAVTLKYGGVKTNPFPDRTRAVDPPGSARVNVRTRPDRLLKGDIVDSLGPNELFTAYQKTSSGVSLAGSKTWYGNKTGNRWVHSSGLTHKGGTT